MSLNSIRQDVFTYFQTNWTTTDIVFQNQRTGDELIQGSDPWVYIYLKFAPKTVQMSLGQNNVRFARTGLVAIKSFCREEDGSAVHYTMADDLEDLFRNKKISETQFKAPGTIFSENPPPGWLSANTTCSFVASSLHDF